MMRMSFMLQLLLLLIVGEVLCLVQPANTYLIPGTILTRSMSQMKMERPLSVNVGKYSRLQASSFPVEYRRGHRAVFSGVKSAVESVAVRARAINEASVWRTMACIFVSSLILFRNLYDVGLVRLWEYLQNSSALLPRMFRHDHWEWMLAVSCFLVWIHGFWLADRAVLHSARKGQVHPWQKFRLQDRYEAQKFQHGLKRRKERGEDADGKQVLSLVTEPSKWHWRAWIFELPVYCVPLFLWDYFVPRRAAKIARLGAPTAFQVCRDVTLGLLLYDILFFCGHFLMHKIPLFYNLVHKKHHTNTECRAAEIVRLSLVEEVLEVGFSIVALNFLKAHPVSRTIYNVIITFLLTELHCGFDFPWTPQNVVPFGFATGSRRHHYHHRFGKHYYQKFFFHVDRLFGFHQRNDGSLHGDSVQPFKNLPSFPRAVS